MAIAKATSADIVERDSILKDQGGEDIIKAAFENGSSVVCARCGELIAKHRWEAHRDKWCSMIPDVDEDEDDDDN